MKPILKSHKLENVCYDIRGKVLQEARRLEEEGYKILHLNIGNTKPFGFEAPDECIHDVIVNMREAQGYCDSKGLFAARKAVMQHCQHKNIDGVEIEDVYIGNGVSELIVMAMQGLLNTGCEVLIPAPDYPLWTAAVNLSGGTPVHYLCDEGADWIPDIADIQKKLTDNTRGIVIINPNNPTGALYPVEVLQQIVDFAAANNLIVFSDEIYDKVLYDGHRHVSTASLSDDVFFVTFGGLSKAYRAPGFRAGWMIVSGNKGGARDYIEGLDILASMRLCSNVPAQFAIQTALGGYQSINDLVAPGGELCVRRDLAWERLTSIPGVSCVKPKGAMYLFPRLDTARFGIHDDRKLVLDFLLEKHVLIVQGTGFNWPHPDHLRFVFLPRHEELVGAIDAFGAFLASYRQ